MTDCSNAEIRDLLPDYVHDRLSVTDLARVEQHLVSCAECTEELALLQTVFDIRPSVSVNVAAIVASLPKPGHRDIATVPAGIEGVRDIASARSAVKKTSGFRYWRSIAAVAVFAVGSLAVLRQVLVSPGENAPTIDTTGIIATLPEVNRNDSMRPLQERGVSLSVGDLSEYSDDELEAIMARLDKWDGATSADPLPGVPILPPGS